MRPYCLNCVMKHLGQAAVLQGEVEAGYEEHAILVYGHLAEATEEIYGISQELATEIRQHRMALIEDEKYQVPYFQLYNKVKTLIKEKGCGSCQKSSDDFKKKLAEKVKNEQL